MSESVEIETALSAIESAIHDDYDGTQQCAELIGHVNDIRAEIKRLNQEIADARR